ncbi:hypothetical protein C8F04DRAFT_1264537 [Mycena alexandri]|uniref:Uncharacterized protein n=1 Tax=Mycena alexandri TaxID=1745969 RepID=A0AAD6WZ11_9AGAR|nr:hypothetical protein C8F04DRAFT_1264537 [Mycena alexandri]
MASTLSSLGRGRQLVGDDGVVIDKRDLEAEADSEGYEVDFIDDSTLPPAEQSSSREAVKFELPPGQVIDIDSSDEDMEATASGDSMFRRPNGVKATLLPASLVTRSKRTSADIQKPTEDVPAKKARREAYASPVARVSSVPAVMQFAPPTVSPDEMTKFMAGWMEEFMAKQAKNSILVTPSRLPRVDFDQLELARGVAASSAESGSKSTRTAKSNARPVVVRRESPVWDIEDEAVAPIRRADKGKGKAVSSGARDARNDVEDVFNVSAKDKDLTDVVDKARAASRSQLSSFIIRRRTGATEAAVHAALSDENSTMGKFFRDHTSVLVEADVVSISGSLSDAGEPPSTAFLEDLETYKNFFDQDAPCGVSDPDIQDPALMSTYRGLPPLPAGRQVLPAYDPARLSGDVYDSDSKGGRAKFSSWKSHIKNMLARNCIGAMLFVDSKPNFINPSRVSPLNLSRQLSSGSSNTQRLLYDGKIAICVSAVFCTDSVVVSPSKIGGKSERFRKWVSGIFHNQDWERFKSLMCLVFGEDILYAQISNKKAISFQTMISPDNVSTSKDLDSRFANNAPTDMFSPIVPKKSTPSRDKPRPIGMPSKTLLAFDEHLPVYDARKTPFDFEFDLPRISTLLPTFTGEIPFSSFIVVGYTASSYTGALSGSTERVAHLGCNIIWVMVCGTPTLRR